MGYVITWVEELTSTLVVVVEDDDLNSVEVAEEAAKDSNLAFADLVASRVSFSFWKNLPTSAFCCCSRSLLTLLRK